MQTEVQQHIRPLASSARYAGASLVLSMLFGLPSWAQSTDNPPWKQRHLPWDTIPAEMMHSSSAQGKPYCGYGAQPFLKPSETLRAHLKVKFDPTVHYISADEPVTNPGMPPFPRSLDFSTHILRSAPQHTEGTICGTKCIFLPGRTSKLTETSVYGNPPGLLDAAKTDSTVKDAHP